MVKTRTVVPIQHPKTGEPIAAGAEIDLDNEAYQSLRAAGSVEASAAEQKEHATPEAQGNYGARVSRADTGQPDEAAEPKRKDRDKEKD